MVIQKSATGRFSSYLALLSFGIGTFLLVMHLLFPQQDMLLLIGFFLCFVCFYTEFHCTAQPHLPVYNQSVRTRNHRHTHHDSLEQYSYCGALFLYNNQ